MPPAEVFHHGGHAAGDRERRVRPAAGRGRQGEPRREDGAGAGAHVHRAADEARARPQQGEGHGPGQQWQGTGRAAELVLAHHEEPARPVLAQAAVRGVRRAEGAAVDRDGVPVRRAGPPAVRAQAAAGQPAVHRLLGRARGAEQAAQAGVRARQRDHGQAQQERPQGASLDRPVQGDPAGDEDQRAQRAPNAAPRGHGPRALRRRPDGRRPRAHAAGPPEQDLRQGVRRQGPQLHLGPKAGHDRVPRQRRPRPAAGRGQGARAPARAARDDPRRGGGEGDDRGRLLRARVPPGPHARARRQQRDICGGAKARDPRRVGDAVRGRQCGAREGCEPHHASRVPNRHREADDQGDLG